MNQADNLPTVNLDSIETYNNLYGLKTRHPLVSVIRSDGTDTLAARHMRLNYGLYALFLKNDARCSIKYGRRQYDYQEGTVVSFSPGQTIEVDVPEGMAVQKVDALLFHPDLIYGTPLAKKIASFHFFDYSQMEAVHLSEEERQIFIDCLDKIDRELDYPADSHSSSVLSASIQLMLEYLHRFYDRQFDTRHQVNSEIVGRFERSLRELYGPGHIHETIPSVSDFASQANLSAGYFSDLVKRETGLPPKEMIIRQVIDSAKHKLTVSDADISSIAYDLGFQYPAHFSRAFKRITGQSPTEFRQNFLR